MQLKAEISQLKKEQQKFYIKLLDANKPCICDCKRVDQVCKPCPHEEYLKYLEWELARLKDLVNQLKKEVEELKKCPRTYTAPT